VKLLHLENNRAGRKGCLQLRMWAQSRRVYLILDGNPGLQEALQLEEAIVALKMDHLSFLEFGLNEWEKMGPTKTEVEIVSSSCCRVQ